MTSEVSPLRNADQSTLPGKAGRHPQRSRQVGVRWALFLWPALVISLALLVLPQANFIWLSFHADLGLARPRLTSQWRTMFG